MADVLMQDRLRLKGFVVLAILSLVNTILALDAAPILTSPSAALGSSLSAATSLSPSAQSSAPDETLSPNSFPACSLSEAPPRRVFRGLYDDALELYAAPLRWDAEDWATLGGIGVVTFVLVKEDPDIFWRFQYQRPWLDTTMPYFTDAADATYAIPGIGAVWLTGELLHNDKLANTSSSALEGMALGGLTSTIIKYAFSAERPSTGATSHEFFDYDFGTVSPSFPSGHTIVAFDLAEVYGAQYGRWWTYPLAFVVAYSRVYLGAHWPSDVFMGACIGTFTGLTVENMDQRKGYLRSWNLSFAPEEDGGASMKASTQF